MSVSVPLFEPHDFGKAAGDYAAYRKGFPDSFFQRLARRGLARAGWRALDLGTGTGTVARGLARLGLQTVGLDISGELLARARELDARAAVEVEYREGRAESVPLPDASLDLVTAGQCWHWFDGPAAMKECLRLLKPGGLLLIAHWSYLPAPGGPAQATEKLVLKLNPRWPLAGQDGRHEEWRAPMEAAGLRGARSFYYDEDSPYTHEEWRGRMRTCNGVLALKDPARIAEFDAKLAALLSKKFPAEPMLLPHRVFAIWGRKPV